MGFNDTDVVRAFLQRQLEDVIESLLIMSGRDIKSSADVTDHLEKGTFLQRWIEGHMNDKATSKPHLSVMFSL